MRSVPPPKPDPSAAAPPTRWTPRPQVPCAWGDVFDRLCILRLKLERVADSSARAHVAQEAAALEAVVGDETQYPAQLQPLLVELAEVNDALWRIEDDIRACERAARFDAAFVALARDVYRQNDRRAEIKRRISLLLGSALIEQKAYHADDPHKG